MPRPVPGSHPILAAISPRTRTPRPIRRPRILVRTAKIGLQWYRRDRDLRSILRKDAASQAVPEMLLAAEYVVAGGNPRVVLCERGIRTFETATRFTLDVAAIPIAKARLGLPVIVDPSHAVGKRGLVAPMAKAAMVVGAAGVMVEVHPNPATALCDGPQSLDGEGFASLMGEPRSLSKALNP